MGKILSSPISSVLISTTLFRKQSLEARIEQFWKWFRENCHRVGTPPAEPVAGLSKQLSRVQKGLVWGCSLPNGTGCAELEISPDGMRELADAARQVVRMAPEIDGWRFIAFRQRSADLMIEVAGQLFGPSDCKAVLLRDKDGTKFLQAFLPDTLDERSRDRLAPILLDHGLGEEFVIQFELLHPLPLSEAPPEARPLDELAMLIVPGP